MEESSGRRVPGWLLPALLGGCLALWLWGGVASHQVDSLVWRVVGVFKNNGNPSNFHYPALVIYLLCLPYGLLSWGEGPDELRRRFVAIERSPERDFISDSLPGHLLIVLFALLGILAVRRSARALGLSDWSALAGMMALGTALLWVSESHLITVDLPLAALVIGASAAALGSLRAEGAPGLGRLCWIGVLSGLATSAKYNGGVVLLPIIAALFWRAHQRKEGRVAALWVPGLAAVVVFLATNPFILLDFGSFLEDFAFELNHAQMGHDGYDVGSGFVFHGGRSLAYGWGRVGLAVSTLGFIACLLRKDLRGPEKVILIGFPALFFGMIGASALTFHRYAIPLLPFLALALAVFVDSVGSWVEARAGRKLGWVALLGVTAIVVLPNAYWSIRHVKTVNAKDVRRELIGVLRESGLTREKPVFCGRYGAVPLIGGKQRVDGSLLVPQVELPDPRADVYMFDAFSHERHIRYEPVMEFVQAYRGFEEWSVLRFSPYRVPYGEVPISQKSLYSPYLPDLALRRCGGPLVELYFCQEADAVKVEEAALRLGVPVERLLGAEGYFLPAIVGRAKELGR